MRNWVLPLWLTSLVPFAVTYTFTPENTTELVESGFPALYDVAESQTISGTTTDSFGTNETYGGSYWASSYITGSDGHQYLVTTHTLFSYYRASILNIDTQEFNYYVSYGEVSSGGTDQFNITAEGWGFGALSADNISTIRTWTDYENLVYDLTFEATSKILFNGGAGAWNWNGDLTYEWAIPAGQTSGSLTINGTEIQIDPLNSFTWYDRQWGGGATNGTWWTWLQINLQDSDLKASVWSTDSDEVGYTKQQFASIRTGSGEQRLLNVDVISSNNTWTSPATGVEYVQEWRIDFGDEGYLDVKSLLPDQELGETGYEGFVTVEGQLKNKTVTGFGIAEIVKQFA